MKNSETLDQVSAVAAGATVRTSGEGLGTERYKYVKDIGGFTAAVVVASEMPVNGVQRSFEPGYTGTV